MNTILIKNIYIRCWAWIIWLLYWSSFEKTEQINWQALMLIKKCWTNSIHTLKSIYNLVIVLTNHASRKKIDTSKFYSTKAWFSMYRNYIIFIVIISSTFLLHSKHLCIQNKQFHQDYEHEVQNWHDTPSKFFILFEFFYYCRTYYLFSWSLNLFQCLFILWFNWTDYPWKRPRSSSDRQFSEHRHHCISFETISESKRNSIFFRFFPNRHLEENVIVAVHVLQHVRLFQSNLIRISRHRKKERKKQKRENMLFFFFKSASDLIHNALLRRNKIKSLTMSAPTCLNERIFRVFLQSTDERLFWTKTRVPITLRNCAASAFNELRAFFKHSSWIERWGCFMIQHWTNFIDVSPILKPEAPSEKKYRKQIVSSEFMEAEPKKQRLKNGEKNGSIIDTIKRFSLKEQHFTINQSTTIAFKLFFASCPNGNDCPKWSTLTDLPREIKPCLPCKTFRRLVYVTPRENARSVL